jgi:hypothetical protein
MYTLPSYEPKNTEAPSALTAGEEVMGPPVVKFHTLLPGEVCGGGEGREKEMGKRVRRRMDKVKHGNDRNLSALQTEAA